MLAAQVLARAQADTNAVRQLSLAETKRAALARNWDLLAARSGVDAAQAQLIIAKEFPNPTLAATSSKIGSREGATLDGNNLWARSYDTIFAINQLFEIGGKRRDRQDAARQNALGAKARFFDAQRTLIQGVTRAYAAALLADENEKILHESAGFMRHEQEIAETRFHAGDLAESDLKQIQVSAGQFVLQESAAAATALSARTALEILLGVRAPRGDWQAADSLEEISQEIGALSIRSARTNIALSPAEQMLGAPLRPDVLAAQTDLHAAEANLKLQKAGRIPDPTISLQYEHNPPGGGPPVDTIGLGLSFPLPVWNQNGGAIRAARAQVEQSRFALEKLRAQMAGDLVSSQAAFNEASARLQKYREEIAPRSKSARESVIFKFEKGGASLVDLLEAQRTDNDVRLATAQAQAATAGTAADLTAAKTALTESELTNVK